MSRARHIAVIGGGLMGHGIALTMARAGHSVNVTDPVAAALATVRERIAASLVAMGAGDETETVLARINLHDGIAGAVQDAGVVFEAGPEKLAVKQAIFAEIETHIAPEAILASNTSVIQITRIMEGLNGRHRALGTHWWNPPHMIPLVEVVKTEWTDPAIAEAMFNLLRDTGKTPVMVEKDVPGFIGNRLQHALWREAIALVEHGICSAEAVDTVVKASFGRRLAVLGPLENADLVGTDLTLDIHENLLFDIDSRPEPSPFLRELVQHGKLGMKSGQGFRPWTKEQADAARARLARHLQRLEKILDN